jgi:thiol-disulfide isomerase/thioredoxin
VVVAVVGAFIAVAALVAVIATTRGDGGTASGIEQTRPVEISGDPLPMLTDPSNDPAVGLTAPSLAGASFDGTPVTVEIGRPTLLVFLAHWCPHCQREVPQLTKWAASGGVPAGVDVIGVSTSASSERPNYSPSAWLEREQFPFPVLADNAKSEAASAYGLEAFPFFVMLDSNGRVVMRVSGEVEPAALTQVVTTVT